MKINEILEGIDYKVLDEDENVEIVKIGNKINLFCMESNSNQFEMERDYYEYLDGHKIPYAFVLLDISKKTLYYINFKGKHNWIKACFDSCDKEKIYLGKQVLNYRISEKDLIGELKKI